MFALYKKNKHTMQNNFQNKIELGKSQKAIISPLSPRYGFGFHIVFEDCSSKSVILNERDGQLHEEDGLLYAKNAYIKTESKLPF